MDYISTRGYEGRLSGAQAICMGQAPDGGLLVPVEIPRLSEDEIRRLGGLSYSGRVAYILGKFLSDFSEDELLDASRAAYDEGRFDGEPAPLVRINPYGAREFILELWHGPTAAFKDMALQLLPHLLTRAATKIGLEREICILTATSGDTGKAALEGFRDVPGTRCVVFYPEDGVSEAQALQMLTTEGDNVAVVAIDGSFDDAQRGVKALFADEALAAELDAQGRVLSSANSINWGRLLPQIAYYWSSYVDLVRSDQIQFGEAVNYVVPTGNFGNILAAWYAMQMGLPVHRLVCASNANNVLSDFIGTGVYDARRDFERTVAPSMDILVSSNLERLLFELTGRDAERVAGWMQQLASEGRYEVDEALKREMQQVFVGGFCDDRGILRTIREVYDLCDRVVDTHTAVAFNVYQRYQRRSNDEHVVIYVSTASPFKFADDVLAALADSRPLNLLGRARGKAEEGRGRRERRDGERRGRGGVQRGRLRDSGSGRRSGRAAQRPVTGFRDSPPAGEGTGRDEGGSRQGEGRRRPRRRRRSDGEAQASGRQGEGRQTDGRQEGQDRQASGQQEGQGQRSRRGARKGRRGGRGRGGERSRRERGPREEQRPERSADLAANGDERLDLRIDGDDYVVEHDSLAEEDDAMQDSPVNQDPDATPIAGDDTQEPQMSDEPLPARDASDVEGEAPAPRVPFFTDDSLPGGLDQPEAGIDSEAISVPETDLDRMLRDYELRSREPEPVRAPLDALAHESGIEIPLPLRDLDSKPQRIKLRCRVDEMGAVVRALLVEGLSEAEVARRFGGPESADTSAHDAPARGGDADEAAGGDTAEATDSVDTGAADASTEAEAT